jgi:hypothetical protein
MKIEIMVINMTSSKELVYSTMVVVYMMLLLLSKWYKGVQKMVPSPIFYLLALIPIGQPTTLME